MGLFKNEKHTYLEDVRLKSEAVAKLKYLASKVRLDDCKVKLGRAAEELSRSSAFKSEKSKALFKTLNAKLEKLENKLENNIDVILREYADAVLEAVKARIQLQNQEEET